jgi:uridine kinase
MAVERKAKGENMQHLVTIYCKNNKQFVQIPCGTSLHDLYHQLALDLPYPVIAARVNYKVQNLNFLIYKPKDI